MNKYLKFALNVCIIAVIVGICFWADGAWAADPFTAITTKASNAFTNTRKVVFTLGAFTLVAIAVGAIFGKINWRWFVSLLVALVILAVAGMIINYFVKENQMATDNALN